MRAINEKKTDIQQLIGATDIEIRDRNNKLENLGIEREQIEHINREIIQYKNTLLVAKENRAKL